MCESVGASGADITGVTAGIGLTGGGVAGDVTLDVAFGGPGAATTVARSDHQHQRGGAESMSVGPLALLSSTGAANVAIGQQALQATTTGINNVALGVRAGLANTTGSFTTAIGHAALQNNTQQSGTAVGAFAMSLNTSACCNTGLGYAALFSNQTGTESTAVGFQSLLFATGSFNTAVGANSLVSTVTGTANTAVGAQALVSNTDGSNNVAFGDSALRNIVAGSSSSTALGHHAGFALTSGSSNIVIGSQAGLLLTGGSNNIYIGSQGAPAESSTIRIGASGSQTAAFISGIFGVPSPAGVGVFINAGGQLGTMSSSRRFKENVERLADARRIVHGLQPVAFHYKPAYDDGSRILQYGLIAEEVAEVEPNLVVTNEDGQVETVRYHFLAPLLLAEVQRLEHERVAQDTTIRAQAAALSSLRDELSALKALVERLTDTHVGRR